MDFEHIKGAFSSADVTRLVVELTAMFPNDPDLGRLEELLNRAFAGAPPPIDVQPATRVYFDSIATLLTNERLKTPARHPACQYVPRQFDFVADLGGVESWSIAQALNWIALSRIKPTKTCAVVGTMRDDGIYIMEWVAHYLALGFEHLFVYTNDNTDGTIELLTALSRHGIVTLIESEVTGEVPPEAKAFGYSLHLLHELRHYEWALFVDSDEYLVPAAQFDNSVPNVLAAVAQAFPDNRAAALCYDWLWFVSDMIFERRPGLLCERFQHARPHWLSKCLVRIRDVYSMRREHHPEMAPGFLVLDSAFNPIDIGAIWERRTAEYSGGRINHYWPRSFQEFAIKKARGAALGPEQNIYDRPYDRFFAWNGHATDENHHPTDPNWCKILHDRIDALRRLDGVAAAADRIEEEWPFILANVADERRLREDYERNRVEPGPL
jgi:hypothetical protein